jgi:hypothetical protein
VRMIGLTPKTQATSNAVCGELIRATGIAAE